MSKGNFDNFPVWLGEDFQPCNVCGEPLAADADLANLTVVNGTKGTRYCKLCGMPTEDGDGFCSQSCEDKFKKFVARGKKKRKRPGK